MISMRLTTFAAVLCAVAGCTEPPTGNAVAPEITFTPAVVVNPGEGASVTVTAAVRGAGRGASLRWTSLSPGVVVVEPSDGGRAAVLRFTAQRAAAVELAVLTPRGVVTEADTLPIGSISAIAPSTAPGR